LIENEDRVLDTLNTIENAYEIWRSGKEPNLSRVIFIGPNKRLKRLKCP
jgi:hypothetical protein